MQNKYHGNFRGIFVEIPKEISNGIVGQISMELRQKFTKKKITNMPRESSKKWKGVPIHHWTKFPLTPFESYIIENIQIKLGDTAHKSFSLKLTQLTWKKSAQSPSQTVNSSALKSIHT